MLGLSLMRFAGEPPKHIANQKKPKHERDASPDSVRDVFEESDSDSTLTIDIDTTQEITSDDNIEQLLKDFWSNDVADISTRQLDILP